MCEGERERERWKREHKSSIAFLTHTKSSENEANIACTGNTSCVHVNSHHKISWFLIFGRRIKGMGRDGSPMI